MFGMCGVFAQLEGDLIPGPHKIPHIRSASLRVFSFDLRGAGLDWFLFRIESIKLLRAHP